LTFAAAIFDVDGVLVDSPHERAWRDTLRELMEGEWRELQPRTTYRPELFTPQLYQERVAGKPRMSGALAVMERFGVPDPHARAQEYGARKQERIIALATAGEFSAFPDALRFVLSVRATGIRVATASSSKNAGLFLRAIRLDTFAAEHGLHYDFLRPETTLLDFVDADISGRDFKRGKPDPEIFLTAVAELGARPADCFVVEDAVRWGPAPRTASSSRMPCRAWPRRRPAGWQRSVSRARTIARSWRRPPPTSWSARSTKSISSRSPPARSRRASGPVQRCRRTAAPPAAFARLGRVVQARRRSSTARPPRLEGVTSARTSSDQPGP
jgi:beta-phosphoglucomutase-like phosphatase (HAD superfamily)